MLLRDKKTLCKAWTETLWWRLQTVNLSIVHLCSCSCPNTSAQKSCSILLDSFHVKSFANQWFINLSFGFVWCHCQTGPSFPTLVPRRHKKLLKSLTTSVLCGWEKRQRKLSSDLCFVVSQCDKCLQKKSSGKVVIFWFPFSTTREILIGWCLPLCRSRWPNYTFCLSHNHLTFVIQFSLTW